jgi:hypothetical protein
MSPQDAPVVDVQMCKRFGDELARAMGLSSPREINQAEFGRSIGKSQGLINKVLGGKSSVSPKMLRATKNLFHTLDVDFILTGKRPVAPVETAAAPNAELERTRGALDAYREMCNNWMGRIESVLKEFAPKGEA